MNPKSDQPPLPYEPSYTGLRELERRRNEVQEWLKRSEWGPDAAPIVQDATEPSPVAIGWLLVCIYPVPVRAAASPTTYSARGPARVVPVAAPRPVGDQRLA